MEMVECDRLGGPRSAPAKMTKLACVRRYRIANEGAPGDKAIKISPCRACPIGQARAVGTPTTPPPHPPGDSPSGVPSGARVIPRMCTRCGDGFRGYPASKFCAKCKGAKKARAKLGLARV